VIESLLQFVLGLVRDHGPLVLFVAALLENAAFLSWALPGEVLLATGGYLIQQGELSAELAWLSVVAGVLIGDHTAYFIGRVGGRRIARRLPFRGGFQKVEKLVEKYGGMAILFGRFTGLRSVMLFTVGTMGLRYRTFWPYELLGAATWSAWWLAVGAFGGIVFERMGDLAIWRQWLLVAAVPIAIVLAWIYRDRLKRFLKEEPEAA
jgi:membrane-associated protein